MLTRRNFLKTVATTAAVSTLTQPLNLVQAAFKVIKLEYSSLAQSNYRSYGKYSYLSYRFPSGN